MLNYISRSQKRAINNIIPVPVNLSIVFQTVTEVEEEEEEKKREKKQFPRHLSHALRSFFGAETSGSGRKQRRDRGKRRVHRWGNTGNATAVPTGIGVAARD